MPEMTIKFAGADVEYATQCIADNVHIFFRVPSHGVSVTLVLTEDHADKLGRELVILRPGEALVSRDRKPRKPRKPKGGT